MCLHSRAPTCILLLPTYVGGHMPDGAAIFVHGILSSTKTWTPLISLLQQDVEASHDYESIPFPYPSPKFNFNPTRRIPDYNTVADSLSTFIAIECAGYRDLLLIGHSQGGLIIQRYLARMLNDGRGLELRKIARVVLLACPNNGSEIVLMLRKFFTFWKNPQEVDLRPLAGAVTDAQRRVINGITHATTMTTTSCPIQFSVYAGETDQIVTYASATSVFLNTGTLPGDHTSILNTSLAGNRTFKAIKTELLTGRTTAAASLPLVINSEEPRSVQDGDGQPRRPLISVTTTKTRQDLSL